MTTEFSKKQNKTETVYTLESATGGSTSAGSIASVSSPMGGVRKRGDNLIAQEADKKPVVPTSKPRNFVAKNATTGGAGAHVDKKRAQKQGNEKHKKPFAESNERQQLSVQQLATISDQALDNAYHYGRSTPGNTFGWQANLKSAEFAKRMIDAGETDIEKISDAIHQGWNVTARAFVKNPEQFDDTEKLRAAGKLDAKLQQREKLMNIGYSQLPDDEQEKDRVVARALLQAIKGEQDVAEGSNSSPFNQEQNLRSKSDKELADLIQFWNRALEKNPDHKNAREQLGLIKMIRAERIGKKLAEKTASKDVTEMDNRTPSGDRRERRANSPEAMTQREKELQNNLKKVSPELRKKLQLPEPKEGVSEDHEIQMASSELQSIAKNAVNLLDLVRRYSEREGLQAWQQSKITKAADYLNSVLQSISGEQHDTGMAENFKDGKNPGRKGLAKRSGVNTGASVSSLRNTARHSSGEKQRMAHWLANMKSGRAKTEGLSWSALDDGLSMEDKLSIFEQYHTVNSLIESIDEDKKKYFLSLFSMSDTPVKKHRYIVVPLSLVNNRIMKLDTPSHMEFLGESDDQMVFRSSTGTVRYPSKTMREISIFNTFTFSSKAGYDKFRSALALKFDTTLPNIELTDQGDANITKDQGVAEGSTQKYEMMLRNGQVKKFVAKDDADARRIAAGHGAKSVIRMKGNVPGDKIGEQGVAEGNKPAYVAARYIDEFADGEHWYIKGTQEIIQRFVQLANSLEDESLTGTEYAPDGAMAKMHTAISGDDDLPIPQWKIVPAQNLEELRPINNNVLIKLSKPDLSDGVGEFMSDFLWGLEEKGLAVVHDDMGDDSDQSMSEVKAVKQRLDPKCWKGKHKEGTKIKGGIRVNNCVPNESHDAYSQRLQATLENTLAEKIPANAPVDVWVQDFQTADPQKYHQFKNKTPEKKAQMAVAASYAAKNPSKKK